MSGEILPARFLPTEPAPTEREYANLLAAQLPAIRTCGKQWYAFEGGRWQKSSRDMYRPKALNILPENHRRERLGKTLLDHLESRFQVDEKAFHGALAFDDSGAVSINVQNGILRVTARAITLLPHDAAFHFTTSLEAVFDRSLDCPLFHNTLVQCLPDEQDRALFQLCCGNFLFPDCRFETALICYGEAGSGKSTIAEPIAAVIGGGSLTRLSMSQICDPKSYHLPKLRFAAVNLGTELDSSALDQSSHFKSLVSGEPVDVRPIYGEPFTMRSHAKLWCLTNGLPQFKNGTDAEQRRMRFIRFELKPPTPDVTLKERLLHERTGVLNFMLTGLQELLSVKGIPLGGKYSKAVHERFTVSNDPLGAFLKERCYIHSEAKITKETLNNAFNEFCDQHNVPKEFGSGWFKRLYERFPNIKPVRGRSEGERVNYISGIQLLPEAQSVQPGQG
jgi:P4 family phage/plasmid primase-like protien